MKNLQGKRIFIQEVGLRDGFQNEPDFIATDDKVALVDGLSRTGVAKIEATSFVSPKAIPALADAEALMQRIARRENVKYSALVPNLRGCERALASRVDEINLVMSASQSHNLANLRMTCEESLAQLREIAAMARGRVSLNASLSVAFGCPFEGAIAERRIADLLQRLVDLGIGGITLCDTTGMANPAQVARLCAMAKARWPGIELTAHFHDTRGMGLANVQAALGAGFDRFDASLGGLGGCPYAPGASGNICTEDLVHMLAAMGCDTGVDLPMLLQLAQRIPGLVGHAVPGQVMKAGVSDRRHVPPLFVRERLQQANLASELASNLASDPGLIEASIQEPIR